MPARVVSKSESCGLETCSTWAQQITVINMTNTQHTNT